MLERTLDEKRQALMASEARQRELEDKFQLYDNSKQIQDRAILDLEVCV